MSAAIFSVILGLVFMTSVLSGIFGMAGGLILMGCLTVLMPVSQAMTLHGFAQLVANGSRAISLWRHIKWKPMSMFVFGFALSGAVMVGITFNPSKALVFFGLGVIPFLTFLPRMPRLDFENRRHAFLCGLSVTAAHMTAGVSGPILDMFFVRSNLNRFEMIGTKAFTQCLGHTLKIAYFGAFLGQTRDLAQPILLVSIFGFSVAGTLLGGKILKRLDEKSFRKYLRYLFIAIGFIYFALGIREIWMSR